MPSCPSSSTSCTSSCPGRPDTTVPVGDQKLLAAQRVGETASRLARYPTETAPDVAVARLEDRFPARGERERPIGDEEDRLELRPHRPREAQSGLPRPGVRA